MKKKPIVFLIIILLFGVLFLFRQKTQSIIRIYNNASEEHLFDAVLSSFVLDSNRIPASLFEISSDTTTVINNFRDYFALSNESLIYCKVLLDNNDTGMVLISRGYDMHLNRQCSNNVNYKYLQDSSNFYNPINGVVVDNQIFIEEQSFQSILAGFFKGNRDLIVYYYQKEENNWEKANSPPLCVE